MNYIVVYVTTKDAAEAERIAQNLVEKKLAACCNIVPAIKSIYRWEGKICQDNETLMIIKTTTQQFSDLELEVKRLHSYSVPEIIALPIALGSAEYLSWITDSQGS